MGVTVVIADITWGSEHRLVNGGSEPQSLSGCLITDKNENF